LRNRVFAKNPVSGGREVFLRQQQGGYLMRVKGIKRGKIIEIFEDIDIPDGEEITIAIETKGSFWESLQRFRQELDAEGVWIEPEVFEGIRDSSPA